MAELRKLNVNTSLQFGELYQFAPSFQARLAEERGLTHWVQRTWHSDTPVHMPEQLLYSTNSDHAWTGVWELKDALVRVSYTTNLKLYTVRVAAASEEVANQVLDHFEHEYPLLKPTASTIPWQFWMSTRNGTKQATRQLAACTWDSIAANYPTGLKPDLGAMMDWDAPPPKVEGRLIIWHGPPGTGKSHALQALATQWKGWCNFCVITDVSAFLAGGSEFMFDVLTEDDEDDEYDRPSGSIIHKEPRWKCLVFEDTGEVMGMDAREKTGPALARLLNLADGVLGQGSNVLILVTTNDDIQKFHPAVVRPGRCRARMEFGLLSPEESVAWAKAHKIQVDPAQHSLADLYSKLAKPIVSKRKPDTPLPGFRKR